MIDKAMYLFLVVEWPRGPTNVLRYITDDPYMIGEDAD